MARPLLLVVSLITLFVLSLKAVMAAEPVAVGENKKLSEKHLTFKNESLDGFSVDKNASRGPSFQYLTGQGVKAYLSHNYGAAEVLLNDALQDGEHKQLKGKELATLLTNLASVYRDEHKYEKAGLLYERALSIKQTRNNGSTLPLPYVLKQYAGFLRRTGRLQEAKYAEEMASADYQPVETIAVRIGQGGADYHAPASAAEGAETGSESVEQALMPAPEPKLPPVLAEPKVSGVGTTVRILYYQSPPGSYYALEGVRMAQMMLARGMPVTLMLDREGVWLSHKGILEGWQIGDKYVLLRDAIKQFAAQGGQILASKKWIDIYGITGDDLQQNVKTLSEEQMADEYVKRQSTILGF